MENPDVVDIINSHSEIRSYFTVKKVLTRISLYKNSYTKIHYIYIYIFKLINILLNQTKIGVKSYVEVCLN